MQAKIIPFKIGTKIAKPGVYSDVPMNVYHGPSLCVGPSISSSGLRTIFSVSPMDYWIESPLNPKRIEPKEKEAFSLGRATHHLALGEKNFKAHFSIRPSKYDSWRTNDAKEWRATELLAGRTVLEPKMIEQIQGMAGLCEWQDGLADSGLANCELFKSGILGGLIEMTIVWQDEETGVWLKARPDALPIDSDMGGDLKTTESVSHDKIEKSIGEWRYDMQAALVRMGLRKTLGIELTAFALIFVMKKPPHCTYVVVLDMGDLDAAEADVRVAVNTFAHCLKKGEWPGPGGRQADAVVARVPEWVKRRAEARRIFLSQDIAA